MPQFHGGSGRISHLSLAHTVAVETSSGHVPELHPDVELLLELNMPNVQLQQKLANKAEGNVWMSLSLSWEWREVRP